MEPLHVLHHVLAIDVRLPESELVARSHDHVDVLGEDRRGEAVDRVVRPGDRFVEVVERDDRHHRPEDLLPDDCHVLAAVGDDRRRIVVALRLVLGTLAAGHDLAAVGGGALHASADRLQLPRAHHGTEVAALVDERVPVRRLAHGRGQPVGEVGGDALVHVGPVGCAAHLARVEEATCLDGPDRQVQVGVRHHDDRMAAAELQAHLRDVLRRELHDPGARPDAARDGHHADERVRGQLLADDRAVAAHDVDDSGGNARLIEDAAELERAVRRDLARLHDDGVAHEERRCHLPRKHVEREVPGHDAPDDADGLPQQQLHVVRLVAGDDLALDAAGPLRRVVEVVRRPVHLAPGLVEGLALLLGQGPGEVLGILSDSGGDLVQVVRAFDRGQLRPRALGPLRALDRLPRILDGRVGHVGDDGAGGRVLDRQRLVALRVDEPTVHVVLIEPVATAIVILRVDRPHPGCGEDVGAEREAAGQPPTGSASATDTTGTGP